MNSRIIRAMSLTCLLALGALTNRAAAQTEPTKPPASSGSNASPMILTLQCEDGRQLVSRDGGSTWQTVEGTGMTNLAVGRGVFSSSRGTAVAYPNPATSYAAINYTTQVSGEVTLSLFDMGGGEVTRLSAGTQPAGAHTTSVDVSGLRDGTYYFRITIGGAAVGGGMVAVVH